MALDLGATKFASMRSRDGSPGPLRTTTIPILNDAAEEFAHIARFLAEDSGSILGQPILCVAPCLDESGRVISWPNRPHWSGFPLLEEMGKCLGAPVGCLGDGEAAALADAKDGNIGAQISLHFGTGVASGIVANGRLLRFGAVNAELGHIALDAKGPPCVCGKTGCVQALWRSCVNGDISPKELAESLARLTLALSQIFPACIVTFGGRLLEVSEDMIENIRSATNRLSPPSAWFPEIRRSSCGLNAPVVGALRQAVRSLSTSPCVATASGPAS